MNRRNEKTTGKAGRKAFEKPRLQTYDKNGFRARTAQVTQRGTGTAPINPLGMQFGGS